MSINDLDLDKIYEDLKEATQCHTCAHFVPGERQTRDSPEWPASCEKLEDENHTATASEFEEIYKIYAELAEKGDCEYYERVT